MKKKEKNQEEIMNEFFKFIESTRVEEEQDDTYSIYLAFSVAGSMLIQMCGLEKFKEVVQDIEKKNEKKGGAHDEQNVGLPTEETKH